jgi:hypothetical protein
VTKLLVRNVESMIRLNQLILEPINVSVVSLCLLNQTQINLFSFGGFRYGSHNE